MNTIKIPGFTAEASLHTTTGHYQGIRNQLSEAGKQGVSPQQWSLEDVARLRPCWRFDCTWVFLDPLRPWQPTRICGLKWVC
jgi:hypothetical protein